MITVFINEKDMKAKEVIDFLRKYECVEFDGEHIPNEETIDAMEELKSGKGKKAKNVDELMRKILG
jgi:hypothetical protein